MVEVAVNHVVELEVAEVQVDIVQQVMVPHLYKVLLYLL